MGLRRPTGAALAIIGAALAVAAMAAATRGPRGTSLALGGKEMASGVTSEIDKYNRVMRVLAHAQDNSASARNKATKVKMGAFEGKFDAAFNKGWRDAQSAARREAAGSLLNLGLEHSAPRIVDDVLGEAAQGFLARVQSLFMQLGGGVSVSSVTLSFNDSLIG